VRVIFVPTAQAFAKEAADHIGEVLEQNPRAALALPSGSTPLGLYAELARRARTGAVHLEEARIFNLDEYCGVAAEDPRSFAHYFRRHLAGPLGLLDDQVDLLNGAAADAGAECARYDCAIEKPTAGRSRASPPTASRSASATCSRHAVFCCSSRGEARRPPRPVSIEGWWTPLGP
jgi:6-phosphogluconolactonase/glucosamine-6-phosphate isomerase/deaminase